MDLEVDAAGTARWGGQVMRCAVGRGGVLREKIEGDGATPCGAFPMRRVLFRADRIARPPSGLPVAALDPADGWCDDPGDPMYNRPVRLPCRPRHERLWRDDGIYDLIVVLGHNDGPVVPRRGSAIFLHVARPDFAATQGCIALASESLLGIVGAAGMGDRVVVLETGRLIAG